MSEIGQLHAYRVYLSFTADVPFELHEDLFRTHEPEDDEELARKVCEDEVAQAIAHYFPTLYRIGCINGGRSRGHYLIVSGDWECPRAPYPWEPNGSAETQLGISANVPLRSSAGAMLQASVCVEAVTPEESFDILKVIGPNHALDDWGGERTPDRLPKEGESLAEWATRVAVSPADMRTLSERLTHFSFNLQAAAAFPMGSSAAHVDWVLKGVVPLSDITSLVAQGGIGKTSFAHQLLVAAGAPEPVGSVKTFLGQDIPGEFNVALFNGEEASDYHFINRQQRAEKQWPGGNRIIRPVSLTRATFQSELVDLARLAKHLPNGRRGILAIDSAQAFFEGDDTKAHVTSEFYQRLREFSQETGWAVLLIHHTGKFPARSLGKFRESVRGSSVHVDIPRNVLGMIVRGAGLIGFGSVKCNLSPEDAWLREGEEVLIQRNSETGIFELVEQRADGRPRATGEDIERVAEAVGHMNQANRTVHKSGNSGLYELHLPSLAGLSRNFIQAALCSLIEIGRVEVRKDGLWLIVPSNDEVHAPHLNN